MATVSPSPSPDQLVVRLRRAEGQLRGVQRMLEEGSDCQQVLVQLAAVKAAVDQVGLHLISERLRSCMARGGGLVSGVADHRAATRAAAPLRGAAAWARARAERRSAWHTDRATR